MTTTQASDARLPPDAPRLGDRSLFPELKAVAYLNHAGVSPASDAVRQGVAGAVDVTARVGGEGVGAMLALRARLREKLAALVGASPSELALTGGTTHGVQAIALSIPWRSGDRVLLLDGEFPANVTPWQRAAQLFGLEVRFLPLAAFERSVDEGLAVLGRALREGARLVAASAVQFRSGLAMPLAEMAALCARHGAELFVDAIQAAGAVPLDVVGLGVDYAAGGGHKWLMGLDGAGWLYVRPERLAGLRPALAGWLSHEDAVRFLVDGPGHLRYDRPLRREVTVFEGGSLASASHAALDASVALLLAVGVPAIHAHANRYLDRLEPLLVERGFTSHRAPEPARRSCILSASPPASRTAREVREALGRAGVVVATPDGRVRFAPHWPNDPDRELGAVAAALDASVR